MVAVAIVANALLEVRVADAKKRPRTTTTRPSTTTTRAPTTTTTSTSVPVTTTTLDVCYWAERACEAPLSMRCLCGTEPCAAGEWCTAASNTCCATQALCRTAGG